ncbi:MAG: SDR family NAD(P)-dependent oxidoreductase [Fusobacteriaceae bacterium]|nr:SDR family NAD(P)-dependent oxidoreductase [Fusobacteriaceae bacterium]MBN2837592.1 SDR family NAD(P)-dependent oxidoreductase [Fusobacteriaceae bacterium]
MKNKIVFISGASGGIGKACAEYFAKDGANLIICSRNMEKLNDFRDFLINSYGVNVLAIELDVKNREKVVETIENLDENWKNIDILINNAGLAKGLEKLYEGNLDDFEDMIDTNIKGLLYLTRQIVPLMIERKGHVINIGSTAGIIAYPNGTVYCATKAAVKFISDGLRMDLVDKEIKVTNIQPGMVETDFSVVRFKGDKEKADNFYKGIEPLTAEDIADIVLYTAKQPKHVQICEVTVTPVHQATGGYVFKK